MSQYNLKYLASLVSPAISTRDTNYILAANAKK
jgi:hypothetical protein